MVSSAKEYLWNYTNERTKKYYAHQLRTRVAILYSFYKSNRIRSSVCIVIVYLYIKSVMKCLLTAKNRDYFR